MSKQVDFKGFCKHYELDINDKNSKIEFKKYCENLEFTNQVFSEEITKEIIKKID